ncbi:polar amino acid transport system substrate-binding protein [Lachnospiraceae bacterium]|nr:polar amino acid transport system substrate-binding protein [Lachnospiraceae bacterium]
MKKTLSLGLAVLMAASLIGCGNTAAKTSTETASTAAASTETGAATTAAPAESGTFTVGFDQDFPPMGFKGDNGEFTGFDLELAAEAAKRMGKEVVFQPIAWDSKDAELDAGTIDCIWNGFTISGREDDYTWSDAYMDNSQVFVVRSDSDIQTAADLAGKVVEVQADSSAEAALKEDANKDLAASFGTLQTTPDYNTAMMDLDMGSVDAIAMDSTVAEYKITSGGMDLRVLDEAFASEQYGIGFKKGNTELCDQVNAVMKEMAADGTLEEISNKWFGRDVTTISK